VGKAAQECKLHAAKEVKRQKRKESKREGAENRLIGRMMEHANTALLH
jgi:hypothetical protein